MTILAWSLIGLGALTLLCWIGVIFRPGRPWDLQPVAEDCPEPPDPPTWPSVCILVPARHEADMLPQTLPALVAQDYPGPWRIVVVDDRSKDATVQVATKHGSTRTTVLVGAELPEGWVGKVWALDQGARVAAEQYLLLTDADILHTPRSLRRLVAESEAENLALNSRMASLRCGTPFERLLIPSFIWFFNLLYPMRRVNDPADPVAAAAGGCVLLRREALVKAGGFTSIRGEIIDDVQLAAQIKKGGGSLRLFLSRNEVRSLREYFGLSGIWHMVRRTAFTELRHSWLRVAGATATMLLMFVAPVVLVGIAAWQGDVDNRLLIAGAIGVLSWALMAALYRPAVRFFGMSGLRAWTLPFAGLLYLLMTIDSARVSDRKDWR